MLEASEAEIAGLPNQKSNQITVVPSHSFWQSLTHAAKEAAGHKSMQASKDPPGQPDGDGDGVGGFGLGAGGEGGDGGTGPGQFVSAAFSASILTW